MSGFGVLNPAGALALAAVGALVLLHLYHRRRRVIPVATLFLWRRLPAPARERRRLRPADLLFLLQLALLLALIGGYLRPFLATARPQAGGAALLLVLDVSASMQAREATGTRFELARARAARQLAALAAGDQVMLVAAAERPHVALRWSGDLVRARERLETLAPLDVPGTLAPAVELALAERRTRPAARIAVLTDLPPEQSGIGADALGGLDYVQIGATDDNVAIASLGVAAPPFRGREAAAATAVVRNYGRAPRRVALEARVGATPWASRVLTLAPRASAHVLLTGPPAEGILTVTLGADDALAVDDTARAWIAPAPPLDLLLASDSRELASTFADVAAALAGSRVEVTSRARFAAEPPAGRRVALLDGFVPATLPPAVNALYVAPPARNAVCPGTDARDHARVIDWDPEHPLLAGLEGLQAIAVERNTPLLEPPWGTPVVLAASADAAYPLLVAGEREGRRTACLGAALTGPLASSDRLPLLMLTLAALRWLAEPYGGGALSLATGVPALAGPGPTSPVDGVGLSVAGDPAVLLAERSGVFRLGPPGAARLVLANLFDDGESDIGRDGGGEWPATAPTAAAPSNDRREIGWWFYLLGAALLAIEWLAWRRSEVGA